MGPVWRYSKLSCHLHFIQQFRCKSYSTFPSRQQQEWLKLWGWRLEWVPASWLHGTQALHLGALGGESRDRKSLFSVPFKQIKIFFFPKKEEKRYCINWALSMQRPDHFSSAISHMAIITNPQKNITGNVTSSFSPGVTRAQRWLQSVNTEIFHISVRCFL